MAPLRRCIHPGCPTLTPKTRCPAHQRERQAELGYDNEYKQRHKQARKALALLVGAGTDCSRCGNPINPNEPWDADQRPWGWAPSHAHCNRSAGATHTP